MSIFGKILKIAPIALVRNLFAPSFLSSRAAPGVKRYLFIAIICIVFKKSLLLSKSKTRLLIFSTDTFSMFKFYLDLEKFDSLYFFCLFFYTLKRLCVNQRKQCNQQTAKVKYTYKSLPSKQKPNIAQAI